MTSPSRTVQMHPWSNDRTSRPLERFCYENEKMKRIVSLRSWRTVLERTSNHHFAGRSRKSFFRQPVMVVCKTVRYSGGGPLPHCASKRGLLAWSSKVKALRELLPWEWKAAREAAAA